MREKSKRRPRAILLPTADLVDTTIVSTKASILAGYQDCPDGSNQALIRLRLHSQPHWSTPPSDHAYDPEEQVMSIGLGQGQKGNRLWC